MQLFLSSIIIFTCGKKIERLLGSRKYGGYLLFSHISSLIAINILYFIIQRIFNIKFVMMSGPFCVPFSLLLLYYSKLSFIFIYIFYY